MHLVERHEAKCRVGHMTNIKKWTFMLWPKFYQMLALAITCCEHIG